MEYVIKLKFSAIMLQWSMHVYEEPPTPTPTPKQAHTRTLAGALYFQFSFLPLQCYVTLVHLQFAISLLPSKLCMLKGFLSCLLMESHLAEAKMYLTLSDMFRFCHIVDDPMQCHFPFFSLTGVLLLHI